MNESYMTTERLKKLSKEIVDEIYSNIQCKTGHLYALYKSYNTKYNGENKYFNTMAKRYKYLLNYISFVRKNKGYWERVYAILLKELNSEANAILMDTEPDTFGG